MYISMLWALYILELVCVALVVVSQLQDWIIRTDISYLMFILSFAVVIMTLFDIIKHNCKHKKRWLLFLILVPIITPLVYLIQRPKILEPDVHLVVLEGA